MKIEDFKPNEPTKIYMDGTTTIKVHVQNDIEVFAWQLEVNGDKSVPTTYYAGLLVHEGYGLATNYWDPYLPEFIPFKIVPATLQD